MNWLFLRGLGREQKHWAPFPKLFEKALPGEKVHLLDLPGVGEESKKTSPKSARGIMEDVRSRFVKLAASTAKGEKSKPQEWGLFSLSLGAMVGLEWLCRYPDDFQRLVLINSSAANLSLPWERLNWKLLPTLLKAASQKDPYLRERAILMLTSNLSKDRLDEVAKEWASFSVAPAALRQASLRQLAAAIAFKAPSKTKIKVPALVLSSMRDRFTSSKCSYALARYYGFSQAVHPTAGHDLTLDDPEWVIEQVRLYIHAKKKA